MKRSAYLFLLTFVSIIMAAQEPQSDRERFEQMRDSLRSLFDAERRDLRQEYADYLRETWEEYRIVKGELHYSDPKPDSIPNALYAEEIIESELEADEIIYEDEDIQIPDAKYNVRDAYDHLNKIRLFFFGNELHLSHSLKFSSLNSLQENDIANLWRSFDCHETDDFLANVIQIKLNKKLNDWAFYRLIEELTSQIDPLRNPDCRIVFQHFVLHECGYKVRIGLLRNKLVLLVPFSEIVYERDFIEDKKTGQKYYIFSGNQLQVTDKIRTVSFTKGKDRGYALSLQLKEVMVMDNPDFEIVTHKYENFTLTTKINVTRILFFKEYPQGPIRIYANARVEDNFEKEFLGQIRLHIQGMNKLESLQWLLHFSQFAFHYQKDQEQFGFEKPLFPEETFYYPFSDCEDRAVLFSYLVRKILKLEVVLLDYPDHMATGVHVNEEVSGTYIKTDKKKYLMCDPSYVAANIGQGMPKYRGVLPKVVKL